MFEVCVQRGVDLDLFVEFGKVLGYFEFDAKVCQGDVLSDAFVAISRVAYSDCSTDVRDVAVALTVSKDCLDSRRGGDANSRGYG